MATLTRILTEPGMGGAIVITAIGAWATFLAILITWVARAPRAPSG